MKRKLLKQISNEWRSNLWLALELLIVSVVMWYLTDRLYTRISIMNEPKGFDTEHCYRIHFADLSEQSPEYIPDRSDDERNNDLQTFLDRLEKRPEIECAAMGQNSYFYNGSNSGTKIIYQTETDTMRTDVLRRYVTPNFPKVFRIHGANGETPEQLSEMLKDFNTILLSENAFERNYGIKSLKDYIGKDFIDTSMWDSIPEVLRASFVTARYDDYTAAEWSESMLRGFPKDGYGYLNEMFVRVRDNMDKDFITNLMNDADSHFRIGNLYIASVQSFDDIRDVHQRGQVQQMKGYFTGAAFLALNIFLGLLGTFWFRTQQRTSEIAIRKANGASRGDIFRRVIGEGELLLLLVTPFAMAFDYLLVHLELTSYYHQTFFEPSRFFACVLISWGFMALMILLGIFIPANRAMSIAPAIALKDE